MSRNSHAHLLLRGTWRKPIKYLLKPMYNAKKPNKRYGPKQQRTHNIRRIHKESRKPTTMTIYSLVRVRIYKKAYKIKPKQNQLLTLYIHTCIHKCVHTVTLVSCVDQMKKKGKQTSNSQKKSIKNIKQNKLCS